MMVDVMDAFPWNTRRRGQGVEHPQLGADLSCECGRKGSPAAREGAHEVHQHALELGVGILVEDDGVDGRVSGELANGRHRTAWQSGVVLHPRQSLFLHGCDHHAVDDEGGCGVVVVARDSENDGHQAPSGAGFTQRT